MARINEYHLKPVLHASKPASNATQPTSNKQIIFAKGLFLGRKTRTKKQNDDVLDLLHRPSHRNFQKSKTYSKTNIYERSPNKQLKDTNPNKTKTNTQTDNSKTPTLRPKTPSKTQRNQTSDHQRKHTNTFPRTARTKRTHPETAAPVQSGRSDRLPKRHGPQTMWRW